MLFWNLNWITEYFKTFASTTKLPSVIKKSDADLTVVQLIKKYGYPVEVYPDIVTADNYLLDVYRIPHGQTGSQRSSTEPQRPAVFLMHGILTSSADFVMMGTKRGLAFLLADMGFDVWLGNARGSRYSKKHLEIDADVNHSYWEFSWHQIGLYDLPAMLDVVRSVTKLEKFTYIGMSQGTTAFYTLLSERPEYNNYINLMIALAPVAYLTDVFSPICRLVLPFYVPLMAFAKSIGLLEFPPKPAGRLISYLKQYFTHHSIVRESLLFLIAIACGYNYDEADKEDHHVIVNHLFDSSSMYQLVHFAQLIYSGQFRKYDYGKKKNLQVYGSPVPPSYNLDNITVPVALYHSQTDWFCGPKDVRRLEESLPNCISRYEVPHSEFHHLDFIISNNVVKLVYEDIFDILREYNKL